MPTHKNPSQTYLRFLNLASAVRGLPGMPLLDAVEERVLNMLAVVWATGGHVTVLDAMQLAPDTSASTVHRRLKSLQAKGLIELSEARGDARVRLINPTAFAIGYFTRLGQCLDRAVRSDVGGSA
jgi:hypothetical protein